MLRVAAQVSSDLNFATHGISNPFKKQPNLKSTSTLIVAP